MIFDHAPSLYRKWEQGGTYRNWNRTLRRRLNPRGHGSKPHIRLKVR